LMARSMMATTRTPGFVRRVSSGNLSTWRVGFHVFLAERPSRLLRTPIGRCVPHPFNHDQCGVIGSLTEVQAEEEPFLGCSAASLTLANCSITTYLLQIRARLPRPLPCLWLLRRKPDPTCRGTRRNTPADATNCPGPALLLQELGGDARALSSRYAVAFPFRPVIPRFKEDAAPTVGRAQHHQPTAADGQHGPPDGVVQGIIHLCGLVKDEEINAREPRMDFFVPGDATIREPLVSSSPRRCSASAGTGRPRCR
jgi:hypothetical protein